MNIKLGEKTYQLNGEPFIYAVDLKDNGHTGKIIRTIYVIECEIDLESEYFVADTSFDVTYDEHVLGTFYVASAHRNINNSHMYLKLLEV